MGAPLRIVVMLAAAAASIASIGGGNFDDPEPDSCSAPQAGSIDTIDVGERNADVFVSLDDGSVVDFISGGQGSPMLPIRYRIEGADLPECVAHRTTLTYCSRFDEPECESLSEINLVTALSTYAEDDGSRATKTLFVIMGTPAERMPLELEVQIGDAIATRTFYVSGLPEPDASVPVDADLTDAPPSDAAADADVGDAASDDAASADAS